MFEGRIAVLLFALVMVVMSCLAGDKSVAVSGQLPVPDKAAVDGSAKMVDEIASADVKQLQSGKISPLEYARKMLGYAKMTDNDVVKFVLYQNAFEQLVVGGEWGKALDLFNQVMRLCGAKYASAMSDKAAPLLEKKAARNKLAKPLNARVSAVKRCLAAIAAVDGELEFAPANEELKQKKAANCVKLGDWGTALPLFAGEKVGKCGEVARWELASPESRSDKLSAESVADYWWGLLEGKSESGLFYESVSRHAAVWYGVALEEGKMSQLKVVLAEKRIASIDQPKSGAKEDAKGGGIQAKKAQDGKTASDMDPILMVPTSERGGVDCRYTLIKPVATSWTAVHYDDSLWTAGHTMFDRSVWNTADIWIRVNFDCAADPKKIKKVFLRYKVDDDIEIWLNGKQIYKNNGAHADYWDVPLEIKGSFIKPKKNTLCVHAHDIYGGRAWRNGQYVDFGLTAHFD